MAIRATIFALFVICCAASLSTVRASVPQTPQGPGQATDASPQAVLDRYCTTCHNQRLRTGGFTLDNVDVTKPCSNSDLWERVIAKLRAGSMPPPGRPRPDAATYRAVASWLETEIDRAWLMQPNPGRLAAVHRLY